MLATTEQIQRYKSAIYLNNTAVTFMSYGEHVKAMETLSDGLSLIKSLVEKEESPATAQKIQAFARTKVLVAQQRLARLQTAAARLSRPVYLDVVCFDGSMVPSFRIRSEEDNDWYTGVALTIDDFVSSDDLDHCVQSTAPVIFLSNFALAHLYASRLSSNGSTKDRMVDAGVRMLDIAQAVLGVKQRTMEMTEGNLFLALVLVNNLCCLHQQDESCRYFDDLFRSSQELDLLLTLSHRLTNLTSAFTPVAGAA